MTKFEQIGINYLLNCTNSEELQNSLNHSCNCCISKGRAMWNDCAHCAIQLNYDMLQAYFEDKTRTTEVLVLGITYKN